MTLSVDVWLRGQDVATTAPIEGVVREPREWTDDDVRAVLQGMLLAMHRLKHPDEAHRPVSLRGLSWIVNAYEEGGVVLALVGHRHGAVALLEPRPLVPLGPAVHHDERPLLLLN